MKIKTLELTNYRSFEHCEVTFDDFYTAVSGKNNAGKSNLFKAIRLIFGYDEFFDPFFSWEDELNYNSNYPQWLVSEPSHINESIKISAGLIVSENQDEELFKLIKTLYEKETEGFQKINLGITLVIPAKEREQYILSINEKQLSDEVKNKQILKQLRTPKSFYYHDSTRQLPRFYPNHRFPFLTEVKEYEPSLDNARKTYAKALKKVARKNETDIANLLGRLKDKYQVEISMLEPDMKSIPFALFLGDKGCSTPIFEWGSGTQNETAILLTLLRAQKSSTLGNTGERYSPLILIEEPESFLHPSAQAEFGQVLIELATEFNLQMIVSTHSVYMLNNKMPTANLLFERTVTRGNFRASRLVEINRDNWMAPFAQVLGLTNDVFEQWGPLVFNQGGCMLLVEGELDKKYFEFFKDGKHGAFALEPTCQIVPYGGTGFFTHPQILQFVKAQFRHLLISFDYDSKDEIEPKLKALGMRREQDYIIIGKDEAGKKSVEGLLPSWVRSTVYDKNQDVVAAALSHESVRKSAESKLKDLLCEEFLKNAKPTDADCGSFYTVVKTINKLIKRNPRKDS